MVALNFSLAGQTLGAEPAPKGATVEAQAVALNAAGKIHEAADAYSNAGKAYAAEGNQGAAAKAYGKASELFEKEAAALLKELDNPKPATPVPVTPAPATPPHPAAVQNAVSAQSGAPAAAPAKAVTLPPLAPTAGNLTGRVVNEMGGPVPSFTIKYSGFEDGKLIINGSENVGADVKGSGGNYAIKVPPGAYRVSAYVTYVYHGRTYNFEAEPLNPPSRHDFNGLGLDYLKTGLVRDFVLKMTAKKANSWEDTETGYINAYYGGRIDFDCEHFAATAPGTPPPLYSTTGAHPYSPDSRLLVTLTPQGPMVDGSTGHVVTINLRLGDNGLYKQCQRGIFPGVYTATASLTTPAGETVPLRISQRGPDSRDLNFREWTPSVIVDFMPNDLGLKLPMGVRAIGLFPAK